MGKIETLTLPITAEGGVVELKRHPGRRSPGCVHFAAGAGAEEAVATIAEVEDQSVLILVNACDSRKSVKTGCKGTRRIPGRRGRKGRAGGPGGQLRGGELIGTARIHLRCEQNRRTWP